MKNFPFLKIFTARRIGPTTLSQLPLVVEVKAEL